MIFDACIFSWSSGLQASQIKAKETDEPQDKKQKISGWDVKPKVRPRADKATAEEATTSKAPMPKKPAEEKDERN